MDNATNCTCCHIEIGFFSKKNICPIQDGGCGKVFCSKCFLYPCVTEKEAQLNGINSKIITFCKSCFKTNSSLDFSVNCKIYGPGKEEAPSIIWLHGGGGCRTMFDIHAKKIAEKGFRCILPDLPGHGSLMDENLTVQSAVNHVIKVVEKETAIYQQKIKPIIIGGSLGGYLTMELIGRAPHLFQAAIIGMCGQNVGVGRGMMASVGLTLMDWATSAFSQETILKGMISECKKNGHIDHQVLIEMALRPGMFFQQNKAQINFLREINAIPNLQKFEGKVLFINGSRDHRDSEGIWVQNCKQGKLLVYEGADHFYSHDSRYLTNFIKDIEQFVLEVTQNNSIQQFQEQKME